MIVKFHPGKHSFRNGASNACVYTKATVQAMPLFPQTRKITRTADAERVFFCLLRLPPQALANKNVLGNDSFRIGCSIKNRFEERVCSQKVYSKNRKSRDKSTVTQLAYFFHNLLLTPNARIAIMPAHKQVF